MDESKKVKEIDGRQRRLKENSNCQIVIRYHRTKACNITSEYAEDNKDDATAPVISNIISRHSFIFFLVLISPELFL